MILLHVKSVHTISIVSHITFGAPHDFPVLELDSLKACDLLSVADRVGHGGGQQVRLQVSLQGRVDAEGAGAFVTLIVTLGFGFGGTTGDLLLPSLLVQFQQFSTWKIRV